MDNAEKMAADIAVKLNGGEWSDGKWYSEGHRKAWVDAVKPYADEIERLREALQKIVDFDWQFRSDGKLGKIEGPCAVIARSALQQNGSE